MNKKKYSIVLVCAIIGIPVIIFLLFLTKKYAGKQNITDAAPVPVTAAYKKNNNRSSPATSILSFRRQATSTEVIIDTGGLSASAVQLDIGFDPLVIRNVSIHPGTFFAKPLILASHIDQKSGEIFYAIAAGPGTIGKTGTGTIATITFDFAQGAFNPTTLYFLPNTKVTARGISQSILKNAYNETLAP